MVSMIVYLYLKKEINTFITIKNKFNRKNLFSNNITFRNESTPTSLQSYGLIPYAQEYHKKGPREVFCNSLVVDGLTFKKDKKMIDFFFYFKEKLKTYRFDGIAGGLQDFTEKRYI